MNDLRKFLDIINESDNDSLIYRWVDMKATKSYIRLNKMIGRTKHWIPRELIGANKISQKRGISFSELPNKWNVHDDDGICFVLNRDKITNPIIDLNGQAIYELGQYYQDISWRRELNARAIKRSLADPDEVFVVGDIDDLGNKIDAILIKRESDAMLFKDYCSEFNIKLRMS